MSQRGSGRALRIVAGVLGVLLILLVAYFVITTFADADQRIHSVHNTAGAVSYLILAAAMLALAWAPGRNVASMQILVIAAVVSFAAGLLGGDLLTGGYVAAPIVAAVLLALYPGRGNVFREPSPVWPLIALAAVAVIPLVAYAITQATLQRNALFPEDPHAAFHHYSQMAVTALALCGTLVAAGLGAAGWRVASWIAGLALVAFGVFSLLFAEHPGAPERAWSWAAAAAGVAAVVAAEGAARVPGVREVPT